MSDRNNLDPVASGKTYVVTAVGDRAPESLDDFVAGGVVTITVASNDQVVGICGAAHRDGDAIVVHEKSDHGSGKDVRTWRIALRDGRFEAVERSIF